MMVAGRGQLFYSSSDYFTTLCVFEQCRLPHGQDENLWFVHLRSPDSRLREPFIIQVPG